MASVTIKKEIIIRLDLSLYEAWVLKGLTQDIVNKDESDAEFSARRSIFEALKEALIDTERVEYTLKEN